MPLIRTLLIDLDGVIRRWDGQQASVEHDFGLPPATLATIAFAPALLEPAITGKITDEMWRQQIADRLAAQFPWCDAAAATEHWSLPVGVVDQAMLALVRQCRRHIPVGLVTNATSRLSRDLDRLQLNGEFDVIISSAVVGAAKPSPAIFQAALAALHAQPTTTLFVDDTPDHVHAAVELGMIGHVYRNPGDFQQLLAQYQIE